MRGSEPLNGVTLQVPISRWATQAGVRGMISYLMALEFLYGLGGFPASRLPFLPPCDRALEHVAKYAHLRNRIHTGGKCSTIESAFRRSSRRNQPAQPITFGNYIWKDAFDVFSSLR
jgi:hypothetical protein